MGDQRKYTIESMGIVSIQRYNGICSIIRIIKTVWAGQKKWVGWLVCWFVGLLVGLLVCLFVLRTALCHLDLINTEKMFCQLH